MRTNNYFGQVRAAKAEALAQHPKNRWMPMDGCFLRYSAIRSLRYSCSQAFRTARYIRRWAQARCRYNPKTPAHCFDAGACAISNPPELPDSIRRTDSHSGTWRAFWNDFLSIWLSIFAGGVISPRLWLNWKPEIENGHSRSHSNQWSREALACSKSRRQADAAGQAGETSGTRGRGIGWPGRQTTPAVADNECRSKTTVFK